MTVTLLRKRKLRLHLMATAASIAVALPNPGYANPQGSTVSAGQALISQNGNTVTITQNSSKAVIDWQSFDIAPGEMTRFDQPGSKAIALNRVSGSAASQIDGKLNANGNIIIVNPNGIVFGSGARVDVNGLIATTADMDNDKFMNSKGKLIFNKPGNPQAVIVNNGTITAKDAGLIGLVAPNVINNGVITANLGKVALASGDTATIDMYGDHLMEVAVSDQVKTQLVSNTGLIEADGGKISLTAAAGSKIVNSLITVSGELAAPAVTEKSGKILIYAEGTNAVRDNVAADKVQKSGNSTVIVSGKLDAAGSKAKSHGGDVTVTGDYVALLDNTVIDASGDTGGGTVRIGGNFHGAGSTATALNTYIDQNTYIFADAIATGNGGNIAVWSDGVTIFSGNIFARGGLISGDGGLVETSGHNSLKADGYVDLTSTKGAKGSYLLDPTDITIYGNFAPNYISTDGTINLANNLQVWFDALSLTGLSNGDAVHQFADLSGNGNNAIATGLDPTYLANGGNGLPAIQFSNGQGFVTQNPIGITGAQPRSIYTVFNQTTAGNANVLGFGAAGLGMVDDLLLYNNTIIGHFYGGGYDTIPGAPAYTQNTLTQAALIYTGSQTFVYKNGAGNTTGMILNTANSPLSIGSGAYSPYNGYSGTISEVAIYNAALSGSANNLFNEYQSAKWGIPLTGPGAIGSETGLVGTEAQSALASIQAGAVTDGYSSFTTGYLNRLSQTSNIILDASHNITLDLQGDTLNIASGKNLTLTAGNQITTASAGGITTNGGNITLNAVNGIVLANPISFNSNGGVINFNNAITLAADTTVNAVSGIVTFGSTIDGNHNLTASGGSFNFDGAIGSLTALNAVSLTSEDSFTLPSITAGSINAMATGGTADITGSAGGILKAVGSAGVTLSAGRNIDLSTTALDTHSDNGLVQITAGGSGTAYLNAIDTGSGSLGVNAYNVYLYGGGLASPSTLIEYLKFDEGSGTTALDSSGHGNNGTLVNGPVYSTNVPAGFSGDSISFDGSNDYVAATPAIGSTATFSMWATWNGSGNPMLFAENTGAPGPDLFFYSGKISWNTYDSANNPFANIPANAANGQFHNYVTVIDPAGTKFYYDGMLVGTAAYRPANSNILQVGGQTGGYNWGGNIDDVRVYNGALSAGEVVALYNGASSWQVGATTINATHNIDLDLKGDTLAVSGGNNLTLAAGNQIVTSSATTIAGTGGAIIVNGALSIGGATNIVSGNGNITFAGLVDGGSTLTVNSGTAGTSFIGKIGNATPLNNLSITGDTVNFGDKLYGTGVLSIKPYTLSRAINLNSGSAGGLQFNAAQLGYIQNDWSSLAFGDASDSGTINLGANSWGNNVSFNTGGNIIVGGVQMGAGNMALNANSAALNAAITLASGKILSGTPTTVTVGAGSGDMVQNGIDIAGSGGVINLAAATFQLNSELLIGKNLSLNGDSTSGSILDAIHLSRVMEIDGSNTGITVNLNALTLENGNGAGLNASGYGGGLFIFAENGRQATININNSTIANNAVTGNYNGGGISVDGNSGNSMLSISNSTITGNSVTGGGIQGGAIYNGSNAGTALLTIRNSTISGNFVDNGSGGLENAVGGGGTVVTAIGNTILAGNSAGGIESDYMSFGGTTLVSSGYNLYGQSFSTGGFIPSGPTDHLLGSAIGTVLGSLNNNGGPSATLALVAGSMAIDAGDSSAIGTLDQRGIIRGSSGTGSGVDIGAYEQAEVHVIADDKEVIYGQSPTYTYTLAGGPSGYLTGFVAPITPEASVGTYAGDIGGGTLAITDNRYVLNVTAGQLKIDPRAVTVIPTTGQNKTYGTLDPVLSYTTSLPTAISGLINGDSLSGALSYDNAGHYTDAGVYVLTLGTLTNSNYIITMQSGAPAFTILKKDISATVQNKTLTYGTVFTALNQNDLADVAWPGLVGPNLSSSLDTVTFTYGGAAPGSMTHVGTYSLGIGTFLDNNYTLTSFNYGTLTVAPAHLTVTANNQAIPYGATDPVLSYNYTGLVNGETSANFTGALARATGNTSGGYVINRNTLTTTGDYVIYAYNPGTLTIGSMPVQPATIVPPSPITPPAVLQLVASTILPDTVTRVSQSAALNLSANNTGEYAFTASSASVAGSSLSTDNSDAASQTHGNNQATEPSQFKENNVADASPGTNINILFMHIDPSLQKLLNTR